MDFNKIVGWATIIGLIITVWKVLREKSRGDEGKKILEEILEALRDFSENDTKEKKLEEKEIPPALEFSSKLLMLPGLEDLGVPVPFAHIPYIIPHVRYGDWVNRGDKLITISFESFHQVTSPSLVKKILFGDKTFVKSFDLHSPISGLVVNLRHTKSRTVSKGKGCGGVFHGIIGDELRLPTILIPSHEPNWDSYELNGVKDKIIKFIRRNWRVNVHNMGGDYTYPGKAYQDIRLGEGMSKYRVFSNELRRVDDIESLFLNDKGAVDWEIVEYADYSQNDDWVDRYIDDLRINNKALYEKLKHLFSNPQLN